MPKEIFKSKDNPFKRCKSSSDVYRTWEAMKRRCLNKNASNYKYYGGRGIAICPEWLIFENFHNNMGDKPKEKSIDRIDNNKNYCKENCRWATPKEQMSNIKTNRLLTYKKKTLTLAQWSRKAGIDYKTFSERINRRKWSIKRTIETPVIKRKPPASAK